MCYCMIKIVLTEILYAEISLHTMWGDAQTKVEVTVFNLF